MAVTKRTRFEVLRRDEHTCQYCGAKAPDVPLQIDHVIPVALGGDDKPGNLVTACRDCNTGKASIQPDSPLVQSLSAEAAAYALGMVDKMTRFRADIESLEDYVYEFHEAWDDWGQGEGDARTLVPLPNDYRMSLFRWKEMGIPVSVLHLAIPVAMMQSKITREKKFGYMAGVVWNMVNQREIDYSVTDETAAVYTHAEAQEFAEMEYLTGHDSGRRAELRKLAARGYVPGQDFLRMHIDGTTNEFIDKYMDGGIAPWQESTLKSDSTFGTTTTSEF